MSPGSETCSKRKERQMPLRAQAVVGMSLATGARIEPRGERDPRIEAAGVEVIDESARAKLMIVAEIARVTVTVRVRV